MSGSAPRSQRAARTRRDIVAAALTVWAGDNHASLGAVAAHAQVGRTTVHRYFPDRAALVAAVDLACRESFDEATRRARIDDDDGATALARLLRELADLDELLALVFADDALVDPETWATGGRRDPFELVVARGRADGSLTSDLPEDWVVLHCWSSLFGASLALRAAGEQWRVGEHLVRTVLGGVAG